MIEISTDKSVSRKLTDLGLTVRQNGNVYICRTQRDNLVVVDFGYDDLIEKEVWSLETYNNPTVNCFENVDDLLEALKNYLK